jgi:hypothetical protein
MAFDDPRYKVANDLHALGYPAVTRVEAGKAAKILIRVFGKREDASASRETNMNDVHFVGWLDARDHGARKCWASSKPTRGNNTGWGRLIHDIGHMVYRYRHPGNRPHGAGEEAIETHVAYYVRFQTDWLTGGLAEKPRQKPHKIPMLEERLANWEAKQRRAETAIKKLNKQLKYYRSKLLK